VRQAPPGEAGPAAAAEFCQIEPKSAAQQLVDGGFTQRYDYALQTIQELSYALWHEYDSADPLRFYGLRLHRGGDAP
jgi:NitT/TauT family transport system substrate-binding protein